jgi:hypothetical protein
MRSILIAILCTFTAFGPASAKVKGWIDPDRINGGGAFIVSIYEVSYAPVQNETAITIACEKSGEVTVDLHIGPRNASYDVSGKTIVTVKFDNQLSFEMTARSFGGAHVINLLRRSNTLLMNVPDYGSTLEFRLDGAGKAFAQFKRQCGL